MSIRSYSELITIPTFEERYEYLKLDGIVGRETFGRDRYLNQILYNSGPWKIFRRDIIIRDNGCDLACDGFDIYGRVYIHHINVITVDDILRADPMVFDPDNVISTAYNTHQAIHYGSKDLLPMNPITRTKHDTCPWKK